MATSAGGPSTGSSSSAPATSSARLSAGSTRPAMNQRKRRRCRRTLDTGTPWGSRWVTGGATSARPGAGAGRAGDIESGMLMIAKLLGTSTKFARAHAMQAAYQRMRPQPRDAEPNLVQRAVEDKQAGQESMLRH